MNDSRHEEDNHGMARLGALYGPDVTFTGVPRCDLADPSSYSDAVAVIVGAPYDSGTSYRSGARMGPLAIRTCDYWSTPGRGRTCRCEWIRCLIWGWWTRATS